MFLIEFRRKLLHLSALIIPVSIHWIGERPMLVILGIGSLLALSGQVLQVRSDRANRLIERIFGSMMRPQERAAVGDPITLNGATWMTISAFLTFLCFPQPISTAAFSMAVVCDTAAALIGQQYGRNTIGTGPKTFEGSAAFLSSGLLVAALTPGLPFLTGAAGALVATFAEASTLTVNDNLIVPFTSGPVMLIVQVVLA